jgi:hypothetical protein
VKLVPGPGGDETFILARSVDRREKEQAMHQRFVERLEIGLGKLKAAADSGRLRDQGTAERRLGRLLERYWRASGAFDVTIRRKTANGKSRLAINYRGNPRWGQWHALADGCYLLRGERDRSACSGVISS